MTDFYEIETRYGAGVYAKQQLSFVRGQGASLFDADGNEYIDCSSGHGVANLGHAHPKVAAAIAGQASTLITLFETFPNDKRAALMQKMAVARAGAGEGLFLQLRHRGGGGSAQVCPALDRTNQHCRGDARFPRADVWLAFGDIQQKIPRRLRAARTGIQPCGVQQHRGAGEGGD